MVMIDVGDPKMAREALCRIQGDVILALSLDLSVSNNDDLIRIERMIDQIDVIRPLGPNGKHGNRHTDNCGCDGVIDWRKLPIVGRMYMDSTGRIKQADGTILLGEIKKGSILRLFFRVFPELTQGPTGYPIMKSSD